MPRVISIDLSDQVPNGSAVRFLRAEMAADYVTPFALVRYSLHGKEPEAGLRLDMDKRIFLDDLPPEEQDRTLGTIAPREIVNVIWSHRLVRDSQASDAIEPPEPAAALP
jgi:hypothetical protein